MDLIVVCLYKRSVWRYRVPQAITHIHNGLEIESCAVPEHELSSVSPSQQPPPFRRPSHHNDRFLRFSNRLMQVSHRDRIGWGMCSRHWWEHLANQSVQSLAMETRNSHPPHSWHSVAPSPLYVPLETAAFAFASIVPLKSHSRSPILHGKVCQSVTLVCLPSQIARQVFTYWVAGVQQDHRHNSCYISPRIESRLHARRSRPLRPVGRDGDKKD